MGINRKSTQLFFGMIAATCAFFLLYFIATPIAITQNSDFLLVNDKPDNETSSANPFKHFWVPFIIMETSETEALTGSNLKLASYKPIGIFHRAVYRLLSPDIISYIGLGILTYYILYIKKKTGRGSELALSIGGHAPPM